jgi:hypothetical protein
MVMHLLDILAIVAGLLFLLLLRLRRRTSAALVNLAANCRWDECHAMLDRGEDNVNGRDGVRSVVLITRTTSHACRHCTTFHLYLQGEPVRCKMQPLFAPI